MNHHQQHVIYYLMEENRVLREQIGIDESISLMISVADLLRRQRGSAGRC
jgi:hypothetical protein